MSRNPTTPSLEDLFELPEDYLKGPQSHALRPALIEGIERKSGQDRLLKYWPKTGTEADGELRELWRHERLQVDRVMSYPGAEEVFAGVVAMIETSDTFCIVHEPGPAPLAGKLRSAPRRFWMRNLDVPANRIILWRNFARLSKALGILHSRGLLHGRIDDYAVFTEGLAEPDFRLGGFEWSLTLAEPRPADPSLQKARSRLESLTYSYAHDWKALASLFASFVGIDPTDIRQEDPYVDSAEIVELTDAEINLLRRAIDPDREDVVESKAMLRLIDSLIRELSGHGDTRRGKFLMLFRPNRKMSETIYELSETTVDSDDIAGQASFIESDLATGARIAVPSGGGEPDRLFVLTETTSYQMQRFADVDNGTWQVGVVTSVRSRSSNPPMRDVELYAVNHPIEVLPTKEAAVRALARNDAMEWTLPVVDDTATVEDAETKTLRQAILLTQAVEAILRTLEILPVEAISKRNERGRTIVQIVGRETSRDETALSVGGRRTADVLEKLFDKDDQGVDVEWRLSTSGGLGGSTIGDVHARFETVVKGERGEPIYEFSVLDLPEREDALFFAQER